MLLGLSKWNLFKKDIQGILTGQSEQIGKNKYLTYFTRISPNHIIASYHLLSND